MENKLLFMELVMVRLENMPVLLSIELLDLLSQPTVIFLQDLESFVKPFKLPQHVETLLLPESSHSLFLVVPTLFALWVIHIELAVIPVVAHTHWITSLLP